MHRSVAHSPAYIRKSYAYCRRPFIIMINYNNYIVLGTGAGEKATTVVTIILVGRMRRKTKRRRFYHRDELCRRLHAKHSNGYYSLGSCGPHGIERCHRYLRIGTFSCFSQSSKIIVVGKYILMPRVHRHDRLKTIKNNNKISFFSIFTDESLDDNGRDRIFFIA